MHYNKRVLLQLTESPVSAKAVKPSNPFFERLCISCPRDYRLPQIQNVPMNIRNLGERWNLQSHPCRTNPSSLFFLYTLCRENASHSRQISARTNLTAGKSVSEEFSGVWPRVTAFNFERGPTFWEKKQAAVKPWTDIGDTPKWSSLIDESPLDQFTKDRLIERISITSKSSKASLYFFSIPFSFLTRLFFTRYTDLRNCFRVC